MSCVIGLVHGKKVFLGCDGIASTEDGDARPIHAVKIFRRGNYLMGFAGSIRTGQIIQRGNFENPENIWGWPEIIREQITEKGALCKRESQADHLESNFLIAHNRKLYEVLCDFQMNEVNENGYTAIGSGSTIALGSLYTSSGLKQFTPQDRIQMALFAAAEFARSCGPPYTIERL